MSSVNLEDIVIINKMKGILYRIGQVCANPAIENESGNDVPENSETIPPAPDLYWPVNRFRDHVNADHSARYDRLRRTDKLKLGILS